MWNYNSKAPVRCFGRKVQPFYPENMISQDDWDENIPLLMLAYWSSLQETRGVSPIFMMLVRELTLLIDKVE